MEQERSTGLLLGPIIGSVVCVTAAFGIGIWVSSVVGATLGWLIASYVVAGLGTIVLSTVIAILWRRFEVRLTGWLVASGVTMLAGVAVWIGRTTAWRFDLVDADAAVFVAAPAVLGAWIAGAASIINLMLGPPEPDRSDRGRPKVPQAEDLQGVRVTPQGVVSVAMAAVAFAVTVYTLRFVNPTFTVGFTRAALDIVMLVILAIGFTHAHVRLAWMVAGDRAYRRGVEVVTSGMYLTWAAIGIAAIFEIDYSDIPFGTLGGIIESIFETLPERFTQLMVVIATVGLATFPIEYLRQSMPRRNRVRRHQQAVRRRAAWRSWISVNRVLGTAGGSVGGLGDRFGAENVAKGTLGERAVGKMLNDAADHHHNLWVFHDLVVPGFDRANIDHAVVSGARLLLVDAKTWPSGVYTTDDAGYLCINGHRYIPPDKLSGMEAMFTAIRDYVPSGTRIASIAVIRPEDGGEVDVSAVDHPGDVRLVSVDDLPDLLDRLASNPGGRADGLILRVAELVPEVDLDTVAST